MFVEVIERKSGYSSLPRAPSSVHSALSLEDPYFHIFKYPRKIHISGRTVKQFECIFRSFQQRFFRLGIFFANSDELYPSRL